MLYVQAYGGPDLGSGELALWAVAVGTAYLACLCARTGNAGVCSVASSVFSFVGYDFCVYAHLRHYSRQFGMYVDS